MKVTRYQELKAKEFDMRLRDIMPKSLFGRSLIILGLPIILLQVLLSYFFFERHWQDVGRRLVLSVAGEILHISDQINLVYEDDNAIELIKYKAEKHFGAYLSFTRNKAIPSNLLPHSKETQIERALSKSLKERIKYPHTFQINPSSKEVIIYVELTHGLLQTTIPIKRIYSSTTYIFIAWMITSSLILLLIAIYFLRQQISPLKTLSKAADAFGKGEVFFPIKVRGSTEVRHLTSAFLDMRERIRLYIEQRTEMLTGIGHDLRTPLTRMKLQIAMLNQKDAKDGLTEDITQMEDMIEAYLSFIKEREEEVIKKVDISKLIGDIILDAKRNGDKIIPKNIETVDAEIRVSAMRRAITNLASNACREGKRVEISLLKKSPHALIIIDDDGPGIKKEHYTNVFKPFYRIESSRNLSTGGLGLGMTIARDIARSNGGDVKLDKSPLGGLRVVLSIPI